MTSPVKLNGRDFDFCGFMCEMSVDESSVQDEPNALAVIVNLGLPSSGLWSLFMFPAHDRQYP